MYSQISDKKNKSKAGLILEENISLSILDRTEIPSLLFIPSHKHINYSSVQTHVGKYCENTFFFKKDDSAGR